MTREHAIIEITRRLVEYYHPERIYLFGSTARCDGGPDLSITHKLRTILAAFRSGRGKLPPRCLNKSGLNCFKLLERRRRVPRPVGILALSPGNWPIANFMMQG